MASHRSVDLRLKAEEVLKTFGARTWPIPVDRIAKFLGAVVRFSPLDIALSGMIYIKDGTPIIGVNSLHHPNRQRFTVSHEIGHLVLHRSHLTSEVHVDKEFPILMRGTEAATGTNRIEIEANAFAAHLLIPDFLLHQALEGNSFDIDDDKPLEELAKKFRVSKQMIEYRITKML